MEFFTDNITITIFLPVWMCAILISFAALKYSSNRKLITFLTALSTFICLLFSLGALNNIRIPIEKNIIWLQTHDINIYFGTLIDKNSAIFLALLMLISLLVQIYSYGYMKNKPEFSRYYIYLNFFNFAMSGLILSSNLIQLYIFWELTGVASYLLIGFFHKEQDVSSAAKRVFFINRVGDFAFLTGIIILSYFAISYDNYTVSALLLFSNADELKNHLISLNTPVTYNLIILLLITGAFVKSAQFPFHTWLIDAMKAPTPVSALIHSATMVCIGIFLILRIYPILTPELNTIILFIGLFTALICAFIAISQTNIKKMLAYSTSSQLGLIFTAIGLGSIPVAIIYLVIHSFTKALLFLCSGIIANAYNSLEMNEMGGLKQRDFYLAMYWLIGALSLSGLFFGGFTSKEMLINLAAQNSSILFLILLTSFMTTFYIFKAYFEIFEGECKNSEHIKEKSMLSSVIIMSFFVIIPGFIFKLSNLNILCAVVFLVNICALLSAFFSFKCKKIPIYPFILNLSEKELFIPLIYNKIGNNFNIICNNFNLFDKYIIDNASDFTAKSFKSASNLISKAQNGNIQTYIAYSIFCIGIILFTLILVYLKAIRG